MAEEKGSRFDGIFGAVSRNEPEAAKQAEEVAKEELTTVASADDFWNDLQEQDMERLQRLAVDIPVSLHRKLKLRCAQTGCKQRDVVIKLLAWVLEGG